jgi:hypothetical protein
LTQLSTPNRALLVLLLLYQNLYMWRTTSTVWCLNFYREGVFIGVNGTSTNLEGSVQVVAGRVEWPPPTFSTDSAFSSSCRHVATKAWAELPQTLADRPKSWVGQPAPVPTWPGVWPTRFSCQINPGGDDHFDIWSTSLCHPLKCSNLVPKFLKSNKH